MSDNIELCIVLDIVENLSEDIGVSGEVGTISASLDERKILSRPDEIAKQLRFGILVAYKAIFLDRCRIVVTGSNKGKGKTAQLGSWEHISDQTLTIGAQEARLTRRRACTYYEL